MSYSKENVPWNKGLKGLQTAYNKGWKGKQKNSLKGKRMPEEWKAKLRKPKSVTHRHSEETKRKISEKQKLRVGALNNHWKGGHTVLMNRVRKERMKIIVGSHSNGEWETLKIQYGFTCPCCRESEPKIKLTQDHIIPVSKGGSDYIENIQPLCKHCNVKKFTKTIKY